MNSILRNFISVVRRFKMAALLNVLGLSVAFAAFMVIMIQLDYDYGFDKFHKESDKIFRLEMSIPQLKLSRVPLINRPLAEQFFASSPHIVAGAITNPLGGYDGNFYIETDDGRNSFKEKMLEVAPEFFDVFTFDFVEGSKDVYIAPGNVFIPLSMARKMFGNESAVGKQIVHNELGNQTILGVYRDFPANSSLGNCICFALNPDENKTSWGNWNYYAYIRVNDASNVPLLVP